jgi:hypothetical protein
VASERSDARDASAPREIPRELVVRTVLCLLIALIAGNFAYIGTLHEHRDFGQMWFAARAILHGQNPYLGIGPGKPFEWWWPWYYPLPAGVAAIPVAPLSEPLAVGLMSFLSAGAFAWALSATGRAPLLAFGSICIWQALYLGQWSPLLASSLVITPIAALLVVKPTIGAAFFLARPTRWAVVGAVVLLAVSFAIQPHWVADWFGALASPNIHPGAAAPHHPPIFFPGGVLALAALARWRRPEARLIVGMACVPQTTMPHEGAPLFLVPRGWIESSILLALSHVLVWWVQNHPQRVNVTAEIGLYGRALPWCIYLPATIMVLRRPNVGPAPEWLERRIARWPAWIRGSPDA